MYDTNSFPQKTFPNEMNLHVLNAQQEKTRQEKQKKKGAGEKAKRKGLKTWLSALHAQTLEVIILHLE